MEITYENINEITDEILRLLIKPLPTHTEYNKYVESLGIDVSDLIKRIETEAYNTIYDFLEAQIVNDALLTSETLSNKDNAELTKIMKQAGY